MKTDSTRIHVSRESVAAIKRHAERMGKRLKRHVSQPEALDDLLARTRTATRRRAKA